VLDRFSSKLRPVNLEFGDVIYQPNQPVDFAYFPTAGVISLLAAFDDGSTVEAGVIGSEGVLGTWIVLGAETTASPGPGAISRSRSEVRCKRSASAIGSLRLNTIAYRSFTFNHNLHNESCLT
jgi:hypothetical protein